MDLVQVLSDALPGAPARTRAPAGDNRPRLAAPPTGGVRSSGVAPAARDGSTRGRLGPARRCPGLARPSSGPSRAPSRPHRDRRPGGPRPFRHGRGPPASSDSSGLPPASSSLRPFDRCSATCRFSASIAEATFCATPGTTPRPAPRGRRGPRPASGRLPASSGHRRGPRRSAPRALSTSAAMAASSS